MFARCGTGYVPVLCRREAEKRTAWERALLQDLTAMTILLATFDDIESIMKSMFNIQDLETGSLQDTLKCAEIVHASLMRAA